VKYVSDHLPGGVDLEVDRNSAVGQVQDDPAQISVAYPGIGVGKKLAAKELSYLFPLGSE
jgi:hypothetical protein